MKDIAAIIDLERIKTLLGTITHTLLGVGYLR